MEKIGAFDKGHTTLEKYQPLTSGSSLKELNSLAAKTTIQLFRDRVDDLYTNWKATEDIRWQRLALMLEEFVELAEGLFNNNPLQALDGIADLLYTVYGTAAQFKLPSEEAFWEVHRSNMTKNSGAMKDGSDATNGKGENYSPPDLMNILIDARID